MVGSEYSWLCDVAKVLELAVLRELVHIALESTLTVFNESLSNPLQFEPLFRFKFQGPQPALDMCR